MVNVYDTILALIPLSTVGISGLLSTLFDIAVAIGLGAFVALLIIVYALFVEPPTDPALGPHQ